MHGMHVLTAQPHDWYQVGMVTIHYRTSEVPSYLSPIHQQLHVQPVPHYLLQHVTSRRLIPFPEVQRLNLQKPPHPVKLTDRDNPVRIFSTIKFGCAYLLRRMLTVIL
jgi:hypothetical protein